MVGHATSSSKTSFKRGTPVWSERRCCAKGWRERERGEDEEGCPGAPALLEKLSFCVALTVSVAKAADGDDCAPDLGRRRIAVLHHKGSVHQERPLFLRPLSAFGAEWNHRIQPAIAFGQFLSLP